MTKQKRRQTLWDLDVYKRQEMDDASYHIESIEEKELPIDPINAYNHMAIYLRWCMAVSYTHLDVYKRQVLPCISRPA